MDKVFGAKASVIIKCSEDISSLASLLSKGLIIPEFNISNRESEPHDLTGSCEALGFEMWLDKTQDGYIFRIQTEHALKEEFNNQMHDLSPWLARYVSEICKIDASPTGA